MAQTKIKKELIDASFGTEWQSAVKTSNFTAEASKGYFINTTSAEVTATLPSNPSVGDIVEFVDYSGTAATNQITITSSNNIEGSSDNKALKVNFASTRLVYSGSTKGWVTSSTSLLESAIPDLSVNYLVVAGGGGGGAGLYAGGGGAGGLRTSYGSTSGGGDNAESTLSLSASTNYTVTVGSGGAGSINNSLRGASGQNSVFSSITSTGGGGGGSRDAQRDGGAGGSGGGISYGATGGAGTTGQGFAGGSSSSGIYGTGGGGASAAGATSSGNGGNGLAGIVKFNLPPALASAAITAAAPTAGKAAAVP